MILAAIFQIGGRTTWSTFNAGTLGYLDKHVLAIMDVEAIPRFSCRHICK